MTPKQVELVQSSWAKVAPNADQVAPMFYNRLFEIAPEVKPLFTSDIQEQGKKLMQMLNVAVTSLTKLDAIVPAVQELGTRHNDYHVEPEHYNSVGQALLWTLNEGLGEEFTPEVEEAWIETYVTLSTVMQEAATTAAV